MARPDTYGPRDREHPRAFGRREMPRYYGTGSYGEGGTGFGGGYGRRELRTDIDEEYRDDYRADYTSRRSYGENPFGYYGQYRFPRGPKGYQRSDERIREDLSDRLMQSTHIDSSEVTISVANCKVTLEGTVPERRMKHAIEDLADSVAGVEDIDNRIRVDRDRQSA
jgi:osmotically-inducible protein OsmY